ncbi:hypothetical protein DTO212C5_2346 [Paecilomyces variotii]|nr:hypothetical protein DTO212C5_2346 [Paecilomyces variotii]
MQSFRLSERKKVMFTQEETAETPNANHVVLENAPTESRSTLGYSDISIAEEEEKDIETGNASPKHKESPVSEHTKQLQDENTVWWDGDDDPANPMNWSEKKKWANIAVMAMITFLTPLASSMFAPSVSQVMEEFHNSNQMLAAFVVSIYVLGLAFGPLVLAPLSEVYGRWIIYFVCNTMYLVFTLACAVSTDLNMMIGFRFLAGIVGSAPLAIGGGTVADLFPVHQRGRALSFYTLGPICGPAVGPVAGGFLAEAKGWRWVFWLLTILSGATIIAQLLFMRETYAVTILARKTKRLQKQTGNYQLRSRLDTGISPRLVLTRAIVRPTKMTLLSPINILLSVSSAFVYGMFYLLLTTFPLVFSETYGFSTGISGLTYLGLGVGNIAGMITFTLTSDRYIKARAAEGKLKPEDRLPLLIAAGPLMAAGLFWYGWSAQAHTHWIVPIIGSALFGFGSMSFFMPVMGYLVDAFTVYAASALAANTVLRSIGGALLPLAGRSMYKTLGFGWGNSLLGFVTVGFCPLLIMLYKFGETVRVKYPIEL